MVADPAPGGTKPVVLKLVFPPPLCDLLLDVLFLQKDLFLPMAYLHVDLCRHWAAFNPLHSLNFLLLS